MPSLDPADLPTHGRSTARSRVSRFARVLTSRSISLMSSGGGSGSASGSQADTATLPLMHRETSVPQEHPPGHVQADFGQT